MTSGGQTLTAFFSRKVSHPTRFTMKMDSINAANAASVFKTLSVAKKNVSEFNQSKFPHNRAVLIMDEMDGLSAGDRGGSQALIKLMETTQCPVICICNDRMHPKVTAPDVLN